MASDMEMRTKQSCVIEFLHADKIAAIDTPLAECLQRPNRDVSTVRRGAVRFSSGDSDVSTVRRGAVRFSSSDSDVRDRPRSGRPCTALSPRNEDRLDQLIRANRRVATRELRTELNVGCSALQTMLATLEYRKLCAAYAHIEHKAHRMQVCQDLLNH
jgi:hypothetical protein